KNVPVVTDERVAREVPQLALLSGLVHAKGSHAFDVAKIALHAALRLDEQWAHIYIDLILSRSPNRAELEGVIMDISKYEFQSEFYKRLIQEKLDEGLRQGLEQGIQQGIQQGLEQGRQQGLQQGIQ